MITNGRRQVLGPAADARRVVRAPGEQTARAGAHSRAPLFRSRTWVALLAAFLLLPAGQASTENYAAAYGDFDAAGVDGGALPATAGAHGTHFNEVFGLNAMARGGAASPSPFR